SQRRRPSWLRTVAVDDFDRDLAGFGRCEGPGRSASANCTALGAAPFLRFFFGFGTGMNDSLGRRPSITVPVGPFGPISKKRVGGSYGPFKTGSSGAASLRRESRAPSLSPTLPPSASLIVAWAYRAGRT